jgi:hypothetical protein
VVHLYVQYFSLAEWKIKDGFDTTTKHLSVTEVTVFPGFSVANAVPIAAMSILVDEKKAT